jgi:hypothetical protein
MGGVMSNTLEKKRKRQRKVAEKLKKAKQSEFYYYEGQKYRGQEFVPLMYAIETWLLTLDEASILRGKGHLTDEEVGKIYRLLIDDLRKNPNFLKNRQPTFSDLEWENNVVPQSIDHLQSLVYNVSELHGFSLQSIVGVLRTLNSSRVTWNEIRGGDRGYIEFLKESLPQDKEEVYNLAGLSNFSEEHVNP